jgi:hypothetical protein
MILAGLDSLLLLFPRFGFLFGFNLHVAREFGGRIERMDGKPGISAATRLPPCFPLGRLSEASQQAEIDQNYHIANFIVSTLVPASAHSV